MSVQVQRRGGTTAEHGTFAGASREITVDTDKKTLVVHDGVKKGGFPLAREDLTNVGALALFNKISELLPDFLSLIVPTGTVWSYSGKTPPKGFLLYDGKTLGNDASEADFMGETYKALYLHQWENLDVVVIENDGGKGLSALADWEAGKRLKLPDTRRKIIVGADSSENVLDRQLGMTGGEEEHKLTIHEMPPHNHQSKQGTVSPAGSDETMASGDDYTHAIANWTLTTSAGDGEPHNNMPPWLALNYIVKL